MATNMDRVVGIALDAIQQVTREGAGFSLEERKQHMAVLKGATDSATSALEAEEEESKKKETEAKDGAKEEKHGSKSKHKEPA